MNLMRKNNIKYDKIAKWIVQAVVFLKIDIYIILLKNRHILKWDSKNRFFVCLILNFLKVLLGGSLRFFL